MKVNFIAVSFSLTIYIAIGLAQASNYLPSAITDNDFHPTPSAAKVALEKVLFYDKILSGNGNTSCATCYHPLTEIMGSPTQTKFQVDNQEYEATLDM